MEGILIEPCGQNDCWERIGVKSKRGKTDRGRWSGWPEKSWFDNSADMSEYLVDMKVGKEDNIDERRQIDANLHILEEGQNWEYQNVSHHYFY